jgi:hypothetical protein
MSAESADSGRQRPSDAVLSTFFPDDSRFRAVDEPRTIPQSWRADRFDLADRDATEYLCRAVLAVRGRYNGVLGSRHIFRAIYVDDDLERLVTRDYEVVEDDDGYRPPADSWRSTLAVPGTFGSPDILDEDAREVLGRLLEDQYSRGEA